MGSKIATLPCPKCSRPNPVEARICGCGHWFLRDTAPPAEQKKFPALNVLMPELLAEPSNRTVSHRAQDQPVRGRPRSAPEMESPEKATALVTEQRSEPITKPETQAASPTIVSSRSAEERGLPVYREITAPGFGDGSSRRRWPVFLSVGAVISAVVAGAFWSGVIGPQATQPSNNFAAVPVAVNEQKEDDRAEEQPAVADVEPETEDVAVQPENTVKDDVRLSASEKDPVPTSKTGQIRPIENTAASANTGDETVELVPIPAAPEKNETQPQPKAANKAVPVARCNDGTYSYRSSRGEVCGQRGGVAEMLGSGGSKKDPAPRENRTYILGPRGGCYYLGKTGSKVYVDKKFCN